MFERTVLPDGPRVITACLPGARSVSIAAYVLAGSRHEQPGQVGAAHFMEHLTFKGTAAYPTARLISEAIEGVGGSFNAATDRESTVYWVRLPRRESGRGMQVLGELICRPTLDPAEVDRERGIIVEEIRSYLEDPGEHAQILFQQAMFGDGPLGREVCGDEAAVGALPVEALRAFWDAAYRPANVVVAVAGDLPHDEAVALAAGAFGRGAAREYLEPARVLLADALDVDRALHGADDPRHEGREGGGVEAEDGKRAVHVDDHPWQPVPLAVEEAIGVGLTVLEQRGAAPKGKGDLSLEPFGVGDLLTTVDADRQGRGRIEETDPAPTIAVDAQPGARGEIDSRW